MPLKLGSLCMPTTTAFTQLALQRALVFCNYLARMLGDLPLNSYRHTSVLGVADSAAHVSITPEDKNLQ